MAGGTSAAMIGIDASDIVNIFGTGSGVEFKSNVSGDLVRIQNSGNVGIGITSPTAYLHLKAGTATASTAPIKLTAGTLLTTPELGTLEYTDNGTIGHLYFTANVAGVVTRLQII